MWTDTWSKIPKHFHEQTTGRVPHCETVLPVFMSLLVHGALSSVTRRYRFSVCVCVNEVSGPSPHFIRLKHFVLVSEQRRESNSTLRTLQIERENLFTSHALNDIILCTYSLLFSHDQLGKRRYVGFIGIRIAYALFWVFTTCKVRFLLLRFLRWQ